MPRRPGLGHGFGLTVRRRPVVELYSGYWAGLKMPFGEASMRGELVAIGPEKPQDRLGTSVPQRAQTTVTIATGLSTRCECAGPNCGPMRFRVTGIGRLCARSRCAADGPPAPHAAPFACRQSCAVFSLLIASSNLVAGWPFARYRHASSSSTRVIKDLVAPSRYGFVQVVIQPHDCKLARRERQISHAERPKS